MFFLYILISFFGILFFINSLKFEFELFFQMENFGKLFLLFLKKNYKKLLFKNNTMG